MSASELIQCPHCLERFDPTKHLQIVRHQGQFCVTSKGIDNSPESKARRVAGAKRGWAKRREKGGD